MRYRRQLHLHIRERRQQQRFVLQQRRKDRNKRSNTQYSLVQRHTPQNQPVEDREREKFLLLHLYYQDYKHIFDLLIIFSLILLFSIYLCKYNNTTVSRVYLCTFLQLFCLFCCAHAIDTFLQRYIGVTNEYRKNRFTSIVLQVKAIMIMVRGGGGVGKEEEKLLSSCCCCCCCYCCCCF